MRLWSLHPKHLDRQGLTACWREALLAQAVLAGRTRGYTRHPQLDRFRAAPDPLDAVGAYLRGVQREASGGASISPPLKPTAMPKAYRYMSVLQVTVRVTAGEK